jgi:23S rRNA pseudouridine1911/1915/1917 synthase
VKKRFSRDRLKALSILRESPSAEVAGSLDLSDDDDSWAAMDETSEAPSGKGPTVSESGLARMTAGPAESGHRLDVVLAAAFPDFSRSQLGRLAREGRILLDGRPAKASQLLTIGQLIAFNQPEPPLTDLRPEPEVRLEVIYEDEQILALNKPWGLAVHPAPGYHGPTLAGGLLAHDPRLTEVGEKFRPGLVHRLDKDTSGVLITARTEPALRALAAAFAGRETQKRYLAFARGRPPQNQGLIDRPIGRHPTQRHKMAVEAAGGRPAKTIYRVLRYFPTSGLSLILLTLITGRTHQARVHLQSLGTPIVADPVYSRGAADLLSRFPHLAPGLQRQMLHARRLTISHPSTGCPLTIRAPWPDDFLFLFQQLSYLETK